MAYTLRIAPKTEEVANQYAAILEVRNAEDSGFDMITAEPTTVPNCEASDYKPTLVPTGIVAEMVDARGVHVGYDLRARSSLVKTTMDIPIGLGTIDAGYRGELKLPLYNRHPRNNVELLVGRGLGQIVAPGHAPFRVEIVRREDLSDSVRGAGGFGSTVTAAIAPVATATAKSE
jgi:dUTP pyrophosphatase